MKSKERIKFTGLDLSRRFVFPLLILSLFFATAARAQAIKVSLVVLQVMIKMKVGIILSR